LVAIYSEEVELLREKSLKCDKYECEMLKYKEKLEEFDMIKVRCEELKDENSVLLETRSFLERQIDQYQVKLSNTNRYENDIHKYKQELNDLQEQFGQDQARICELLETQTRLELEVKNLINENHALNEELVYFKNKSTTVSTTIVQQNNSSSAKVLQLELDFKKLDTDMCNLKQNESKLQNELSQKNREIESLKKEIQSLKQNESNENSKIKELSLQLIKLQFDEKQLRKQKTLEDEEELNRCKIEIDSLKIKLCELEEEKCQVTQKFDSLSNENYSKQLKIIELEQDIKKLNKLNDLLKEDLNKAYGEKESHENKNRILDKEVFKLKQQIEAKNMSLDECMKKIKTLADECQQEQKLKKQIYTLEKQIEEFRKKNLDLKQEVGVYCLAID
jgi:chromosome segregation ATPase